MAQSIKSKRWQRPCYDGGLPADSRERDRIARLLPQEINGHIPVGCSLRVPDYGKTGRAFISGSRKTIYCRDCSFPCATAQGAFKPVRRDCLSLRRRECDTSGSPLPVCRTEPAQAVRSISGSGSLIFRAPPVL